MKKHILFYIPIILLVMYIILFFTLHIYVYKILPAKIEVANPSMVYSGSYYNGIMANISFITVAISILLKIIFNKKRCNIEKTENVIVLIIFIILILIAFILPIMFSMA